MSDIQYYKLPDVGEGLVEAEIITWQVKVGDVIKVNDPVVEIETAKSLVELPSPYAGTITELLVEEGTTVDVGTPIMSISASGASLTGDTPEAPAPKVETQMNENAKEAADDEPSDDEPKEERQAVLVGYGPRTGAAKRRTRKKDADETSEPVETTKQKAQSVPQAQSQASRPAATSNETRVLAKPPVRKLAKDLGIDLRDVPASGDGGIVTRDDVMSFADNNGSGDDQGQGSQGQSSSSSAAPVGGETRIPIKGVRKMTAEAMVNSAFTAPHVTEFITVDVTETMNLVESLKTDRAFDGVKVSPLLAVMKAVLLGIKRNPEINASWDEDAREIIIKHYVNLGIAASTPRGLVVPNIKNADQMDLRTLGENLGDLIKTARAGKTQPDQMSNGTISITNVGVFGVDTGTPILNPGEAAILALGAIREQPWVVDGEIQIRWITTLGLSFDHRLVDGDLGSRFLADVASVLRDPSKALVWG